MTHGSAVDNPLTCGISALLDTENTIWTRCRDLFLDKTFDLEPRHPRESRPSPYKAESPFDSSCGMWPCRVKLRNLCGVAKRTLDRCRCFPKIDARLVGAVCITKRENSVEGPTDCAIRHSVHSPIECSACHFGIQV